MPSPVNTPEAVLTVKSGASQRMHRTVLEALATQAGSFEALREAGVAGTRNLVVEIAQLLDPDWEPTAPPRSWRFVQTDERYLGPAHFATGPASLVTSCGQHSVWVKTEGYELRTGHTATPVMAVEHTKTSTTFVAPDGEGTATCDVDKIALARELSELHSYVTAVPCSFSAAVQRPLTRLHAMLQQSRDDSVALA